MRKEKFDNTKSADVIVTKVCGGNGSNNWYWILRNKKMSNLEKQFWRLIEAEKMPLPEREYRFDTKRRWRFDFAWPDKKIAVEIEGGVWTGGRHNRAKGFIGDCEKYNVAVMQGWRVLRYTTEIINVNEIKCLL